MRRRFTSAATDTADRPVTVELQLGVRMRQELLERECDTAAATRRIEHDRPRAVELRNGIEQRLAELAVTDDRDRAGVGKDVPQRDTALRRVHRHAQRTQEDDAEMGPDELGTIPHHQRDAVTRSDAEGGEAVRRSQRNALHVAP